MRKLDRLGVLVKEETHAAKTGELTGRFYQPIPLARFRFGLKRERAAAQPAAARDVGLRLQKAKKLLGAEGENAAS
jgi:hypothetical protein